MPAQQTNLYKVKNLFIDGREALEWEQQVYSVKATEQQAADIALDNSYHVEQDTTVGLQPTHTFVKDNGVYVFEPLSVGGRRRSSKPSQKRPTARRRRSSKSRKARKARATRRR